MKNDLPDRLDLIEQMLYRMKRDIITNMSSLDALMKHLNVPDDLMDDAYEDMLKIEREEETGIEYCPHCGGHHNSSAIHCGWKCPLDPERK